MDIVYTKHDYEAPEGFRLCTWCGQERIDQRHFPTPSRGWLSMSSVPKNATKIQVIMRDGTKHEAHWAQDLSGEDMPPFRGWFRTDDDGGFSQIDEPVGWKPLSAD